VKYTVHAEWHRKAHGWTEEEGFLKIPGTSRAQAVIIIWDSGR
jgi:hypothetical protein